MTGVILQKLEMIVGARNVLANDVELDPYLRDPRGRFRGAALCVVRPDSTDEVAAIVRLCAQSSTAIVPQGGNTGMCGGAIPIELPSAIVLSLGRMNRIRDIDANNNTISVDAGCILANVQKQADDMDRLFPMSLGSEGSCQIGGNISTNAGGVSVLRYGPMRDLVLGVEVVWPDGTVLDAMKALRKDNTGYSLKDLVIGSEGTLGIVTGAVLKLFPKPGGRAVALIGLGGIGAALPLLHLLQSRAGAALTGFEVMSGGQYDLVMQLPQAPNRLLAEPHAWLAVVELAGQHAGGELREKLAEIIADALGNGLVDDAVLAASESQADAIWTLRHSVTAANVRAGWSISHDTSVPVSRIPEFVRGVEQQVAEAVPDARMVFVGHVGDGNIHAVAILPRHGASTPDEATKERIAAIVDDVTVGLGGSISAEHGIGRLNKARLASYASPAELSLMRRIKQTLDPTMLMNPGALF